MAGDLALNLAAAEPAGFPWRSAASGVGSRHSNSSWGSTPQNPSAGGLALRPRGPGTAHFPALEPEALGENHRAPPGACKSGDNGRAGGIPPSFGAASYLPWPPPSAPEPRDAVIAGGALGPSHAR